jgi:hypothetical protein
MIFDAPPARRWVNPARNMVDIQPMASNSSPSAMSGGKPITNGRPVELI